MEFKKRILVAPLNWGLGHAARCIPIINALQTHGFEPLLASDGSALALLQKEFPKLETIALPSYNISYPKKGQFFKFKMLQNSPKLVKAVKAERKIIKSIVESYNLNGIISDNRLGVYSKHIPSVFITHQLQVLTGNTTWLSTKMHQNIIKKFNACWVPDNLGEDNLSGKLGHPEITEAHVKYIGPLSRFSKKHLNEKYDLLVLLSGPEPQRTLLEKKLLTELKFYLGQVLFVKGVVEDKKTIRKDNHITICNFLTSSDLEDALNESKHVLSRSGYTTVMDLAKLNKKAFFIPTPGQFEQEYLAERFTKLGLVASCSQKEFSIDKLKMIEDFKGLSTVEYDTNYNKLFSLF